MFTYEIVIDSWLSEIVEKCFAFITIIFHVANATKIEILQLIHILTTLHISSENVNIMLDRYVPK